jgi:Flp pilus assembly protein TadD
MVYFMQRRYDDALPHFEEAVRLRPEDAGIRTNLGALLATRGDYPRAIREFEAALKINPDDTAARDYLARVRAQMGAKK